MEEAMSKPGGSLPSASNVRLLTTREWLKQEIPFGVEDFGTASSSRSGRSRLQFLAHWDGLPGLVDEYVEHFENTDPHLPRVARFHVFLRTSNEADASHCFRSVLNDVVDVLRLPYATSSQVAIPDSRGPDVGVDERVARLAASPTQFADIVVYDGSKPLLVVEMKKPGLFRRHAHAGIPCLHLREQSANEGMLLAVEKLFGYMEMLNLRYGILSSFDLIYVAHHQGDFGDTLFISDGIDRGSKRFLGVIAFMLRRASEDPGDFKKEVPKPISPTHAPRGLRPRGPQDENKGMEKARAVRQRQRTEGMMTRSQGRLQETPAELLHLAEHHFATGWSGKIVRGNYEGQSIVVKLAPVGSDRAEAVVTEVSAYQMLREFWGKYVPPLVSYGTTVGGTVVYIGTEEFNGYEMGMGPLSQEVVQEMFDALAAVHQCGILHGDIRPSNILVAKGQHACVRFIDFGFACFDTSDEGCQRENAQLASLVRSFTVSGVDGTSRFQLAQKVV